MHLTPKEAADRLRTSIGTLSNWRVQGAGPRFVKIGRKVLYPLSEIEAYEQRQLRASTSQRVA